MRSRNRILCLLLAFVLVALPLAGCASTNKPLNYLKQALENTLQDRFGGETLATLAEALNGGMVQLRYDGGTAPLLQTPLRAADVTLWSDRDAQSLSAAGSVAVGNRTYDGKLFLDRDSLVVSSDALLGSTDLGIDFNTLTEDLKNSIFRNNSGTEYMIPWLGGNAAADITTLRDGFFTVFGSAEEWLLLADETAELFLECLLENLSGEWYSKDGRVIIKIEITNGILSRSLRDLHEAVVEDGAFCRELRRIAATRDAVESALAGSGIKTSEWTVFVEDLLESKAVINDWCDYIDNKLPSFSLKLDAAVRSAKDIIETAEVQLKVDNAHVFTVGLDLSADDTNVIRLERDGVQRTLTYRVVEDGLSAYCAKIIYEKKDAITGQAPLCVMGELNADRMEDFYELILVEGKETRRFVGSFDKKIDGFSFSVDEAFVNGEARGFSLSLLVDVDASPEAAPEDCKNFFNLSHGEYKPIHARATAALETLKGDWGNAPLTPIPWIDLLLQAAGIKESIS